MIRGSLGGAFCTVSLHGASAGRLVVGRLWITPHVRLRIPALRYGDGFSADERKPHASHPGGSPPLQFEHRLALERCGRRQQAQCPVGVAKIITIVMACFALLALNSHCSSC